MVVELHRKVSSLIEYLKQKWTYHDQRIVSSKTAHANHSHSHVTEQQETIKMLLKTHITLSVVDGKEFETCF